MFSAELVHTVSVGGVKDITSKAGGKCVIVSPIKVTDLGSIYMRNGGYCIRCCDVGCNLPQMDGPDSILYAVIECLMYHEIVAEVK